MAAIAHNEYRLIGLQKKKPIPPSLSPILACFSSPTERGREKERERPLIAATCKFEGNKNDPYSYRLRSQFWQILRRRPVTSRGECEDHATRTTDSLTRRRSLKRLSALTRCLRGMSRQHLPFPPARAGGGGVGWREKRRADRGEKAFLRE